MFFNLILHINYAEAKGGIATARVILFYRKGIRFMVIDFEKAFATDKRHDKIIDKQTKFFNDLAALNEDEKDFDNSFASYAGREKYQNAKIETGMKLFDELSVGGLTAGHFTVLRGMSGAGKTTLAIQWAKHIATTGNIVFYFAYETNVITARTKMLNSDLFLAREKQIEGQPSTAEHLTERYYKNFSADLWQIIEKCHRQLNALLRVEGKQYRHLNVIDCSKNPLSARDIADYITAFINATGITPIIFIDYLQKLKPQNENGSLISSDKAALDPNLDCLTSLAQTYGVAVIGLSSVSKQYYKNPLADEADEGTIRILYSADELYVLDYKRGQKDAIEDIFSPEGYRQMFLHCKKNRDTQKVTLPLNFYARADFLDDGFYQSGTNRFTKKQFEKIFC